MKVRVVWFGRPAASPFEREIEHYRSRVARRWPAEDLPVRPARGGRDGDPQRALAGEAEAARRVVPGGWRLVALDRRGRGLSSEQLAGWMGAREADGSDGVALVVGSDLGLEPALTGAADLRLSLGAVTLPHLLARLVLWEQLYRCTQILGGGRYHRRPAAPAGVE